MNQSEKIKSLLDLVPAMQADSQKRLEESLSKTDFKDPTSVAKYLTLLNQTHISLCESNEDMFARLANVLANMSTVLAMTARIFSPIIQISPVDLVNKLTEGAITSLIEANLHLRDTDFNLDEALKGAREKMGL